MHRDIRLLLTNTSLLFSSRSIVMAARGVYAIVLARWLGPEIYGLYNYGLSWYLAFMPFAYWGISFILSREIGRQRNDPAATTTIVSTLFTTRVVTSATAAICCVFLGLVFEETHSNRVLLFAFSFALLGRSVAIWCSEVFVAWERATLTFKLQSSLRLLEVLAGTGLVYVGYGLKTIVILHLFSWWLEATVGLLLVRRQIVRFGWHNQYKDGVRYLCQGVPLTIMDFASTWLMVGPVILYRHLTDNLAALGELTFALQIFFMLVSVVASFSIAVLPLMSRLTAAAGQRDIQLAVSSYKAGFLFASLAIVAGTALVPTLVDLLLTEAYAHTDTLLIASLWLLLPVATAAALQQSLIAAGGDRIVLYSNLTGALIMTLVFPMSVAVYDSFGALVAAGAGLTATLLVQLAVFAARDGASWVKDTFCALLALGISYVICLWLLPAAFWLACLVAVPVLVMLFLLWVLDETERKRLMALLGGSIRARPQS